eukprot:TRINITY_DN38622_c0_g1_i1.p1 TRINITY_DN38622_c0_g1~~TRINITY_DN38622_c0_g1_i1.p1  ORF type:complete len:158 (-),score=5.64 TRINITY_DN38622_c0_g1_i1:31-504(-)
MTGFLYRNPAETSEWHDRFNSMMDAAILESKEIILMGDFNIDLTVPGARWNNTYAMYGLEQIIDRPTRITVHSETLIDHIYVNTKVNIVERCSVQTGCSDHCSVCLTWVKKGINIPKPGHKEIAYRCFTNFDKQAFLTDLFQSGLEYVYQLSLIHIS